MGHQTQAKREAGIVRLYWTTDMPEQNGRYWIKEFFDSAPFIATVYADCGILSANGNWHAIDEWEGAQWSHIAEQGSEQFEKVAGTPTWRPGPFSIQIEIPANIVVDILAGKTTIDKALGLRKDERLYQALSEGWEVESCSLKSGNREQGEAPKVVLELAPA